MKYLSKSVYGFAHHLLIMSLVALLVVGSAGYYVWGQQHVQDALAQTGQTDGNAGEFNPVSPYRLLDTRDGTGGTNGAIPAYGEISLKVTDRGVIPSSNQVSAGFFNFTVVSPKAKGYLTAYPAGSARPEVSIINFVSNENRANTATLKLGSNGEITIYNGSSSTIHLISDIMGYYSSVNGPDGMRLNQSNSYTRVLDTRTGTGAPKARINAHSSIKVPLTSMNGYDSAAAVYGTLTAVNPSAIGYLTIYPSDEEQPLASIINFYPSKNVANSTIVGLGANKEITIYNGSSGTVDVIFDAKGYFAKFNYSGGDVNFSNSGRFIPIDPIRIVDTRKGFGLGGSLGYAGFLKRAQADFNVGGIGDIPNDYLLSLSANVAIVNPNKKGWAEFSPGLGETSSINYEVNQNVAASIIMKADRYSAQKTSRITLPPSDSAFKTDLIVDVYGYYLAGQQ
ncbi:hypothetical protein H6798_00650 [Candidatus Nomurabacteria bacterium]|nr:hypothetical protein [Candidatus Nomurabacteria bacterium]